MAQNRPSIAKKSTFERKKFTVFGLTFHQIFEIICAIGFLVQLTLILVNYFSYQTLTRVYLTVPEDTPLPDIVICFDIAYIVNWTHVIAKYPELRPVFGVPNNVRGETEVRKYVFKGRSKGGLLQMLAQRLTIREMTGIIFTNDELVVSINIIDYTKEESRNFCAIRNVYRDFRYCYIFCCSIKKNISFSVSDADKTSIQTELFQSELNQKILNLNPNFFITLVYPNSPPRGNLLRWDTMMLYGEPRFYKIHYFIFERTLLPSPYKSNCFDYRKLGYHSAIDMKDICFNNKSMQLVGVPFHASTVSPDLDTQLGFVKYTANQFNDTFRAILYKIVDECFELTDKPDCYMLSYYIRPRNPITIIGNNSIICIDQIKEPTIKVALEPRLKFLDVIITIGSISGTWFGFSIAEHVPKIYQSSWSKVAKYIAFESKQRRPEKMFIRELQKRASKRISTISEQIEPRSNNYPGYQPIYLNYGL